MINGYYPGQIDTAVNNRVQRNTTIYMWPYYDRISPCRLRGYTDVVSVDLGKYFISTNLLYDKITNRKIYSSTANDMYVYYIVLQHSIFNLLLNQFSLSKVIVCKFIHSGLLKFSIIILPEFAIFVVFLVTGWMVPIALYVAATKLVSVII
jgi:hypothetical protein